MYTYREFDTRVFARFFHDLAPRRIFDTVFVQDCPFNRQLRLLVSPRDSHELLPTIGEGTQTPEFYIGNTKGFVNKHPEL